LVGSPWASHLSQSLPALRVGEDAFLAVATAWQVGMIVLAAWAVVAALLAARLFRWD
jgi:ABC-2 type transport system permease protein